MARPTREERVRVCVRVCVCGTECSKQWPGLHVKNVCVCQYVCACVCACVCVCLCVCVCYRM